MPPLDVPTPEDWGDLTEDHEVEYGFETFGGKTIDEALSLFRENPSERAAELHFAPTKVFNYYAFCFRQLLMSPESRGEFSMASSFLGLTLIHAQKDPSALTPVWNELIEAVRFVASNQEFYDADVDIFGSFEELRIQIETAYERSNKRGV